MTEAATIERPAAAPALVADPIIWRQDFQDRLGICSNTLRRWLKANRMPKPDINPTRQTMGWRLSTLRASGFNIG